MAGAEGDDPFGLALENKRHEEAEEVLVAENVDLEGVEEALLESLVVLAPGRQVALISSCFWYPELRKYGGARSYMTLIGSKLGPALATPTLAMR